MFMVLLNVLAEVDHFEGPAAKHIMFTMGDDFTYQVKHLSFNKKNIGCKLLSAQKHLNSLKECF